MHFRMGIRLIHNLTADAPPQRPGRIEGHSQDVRLVVSTKIGYC